MSTVETRSSAIANKPPEAWCISYYVMFSREVKWRCRRWRTSDSQNCVFTTFHLTPSTRGSPPPIGFTFVMRKLEDLGYNLVQVAWLSTWVQDISVTDRQPGRHSKCRANARSMRRAAKMVWVTFVRGNAGAYSLPSAMNVKRSQWDATDHETEHESKWYRRQQTCSEKLLPTPHSTLSLPPVPR